MEVIRANGLEIAYERAGNGPPLVFVHGAASDGRMWQPQLAALSDEFTVVAWDEPGAGRSADVPRDFRLADYASCLAALIDALELGPAHVAGLPWGGTVALELYRDPPDVVATLILVDTYAGWKGSLSEEEVRARIAGVDAMLTAAPGEFDPALPGLFAGEPPAGFPPLMEAMYAPICAMYCLASRRRRCSSGASRMCARHSASHASSSRESLARRSSGSPLPGMSAISSSPSCSTRRCAGSAAPTPAPV